MSTNRAKLPRKLKRNNNTISFLIISLFVIASFALTIPKLLGKSSEVQTKTIVQITAEDDVVLLPTPTRNIARGEKLGNIEFTSIKWPRSQISDEYLNDISQYKHAIATTALPRFLPVPFSAISTTHIDSNAVVEGIPEGMRAITVKVDAESAVEGWARSGNYIDVIVIKQSNDASVGLEAKVIAENVKILSAGRSTTPLESSTTAPQAPATVTILVTQEDALKIKTASSIGKLTFALRGTGDQSPTLSIAMDQKRLLGQSKQAENIKQAASFKGHARGPDGKSYVLTDKSEWLRHPEADQPTSKPEA